MIEGESVDMGSKVKEIKRLRCSECKGRKEFYLFTPVQQPEPTPVCCKCQQKARQVKKYGLTNTMAVPQVQSRKKIADAWRRSAQKFFKVPHAKRGT